MCFICSLMCSLVTWLSQVCARPWRWRHHSDPGVATVCSGNNESRENSVWIQAAGGDVSPRPNLQACCCHSFLGHKELQWLMEETHQPQGPCTKGEEMEGWVWMGCMMKRPNDDQNYRHRSWGSPLLTPRTCPPSDSGTRILASQDWEEPSRRKWGILGGF